MTTDTDVPAGGEPWIGERNTEPGCSCRLIQAEDAPFCGAPVTVHVVSESAIHGPVRLSTCPDHLDFARNAGNLLNEHTPGDADCLAWCDQEDLD